MQSYKHYNFYCMYVLCVCAVFICMRVRVCAYVCACECVTATANNSIEINVQHDEKYIKQILIQTTS